MKKVVVTPELGKQLGRILYRDGICYLGYSASEIGILYSGNRILADILTDDFRKEERLQGWIGVMVGEDSEPWKRIPLEAAEAEYLLFDREEYARYRGVAAESLPAKLSVRVIKYSEVAFGVAGIRYLLVDEDATMEALPQKAKRIEFIGDSITCGYGIEGVWNIDEFCTAQENPMKNYALQTVRALGADYQLVSWSGIGLITDWIPPEKDEPDTTVLMPMLYPYTNRMFCERQKMAQEEWDFSRFQPDAVVIHLGTNDASYTREMPEREAMFVAAYRGLYAEVRSHYGSKIPVVCCLGIMDRTLCPVIEKMVQELRADGENVHYVEFAGQREEDGIAADWHPSEKTHTIAAGVLTEKLKELL